MRREEEGDEGGRGLGLRHEAWTSTPSQNNPKIYLEKQCLQIAYTNAPMGGWVRARGRPNYLLGNTTL